MFKTNLARSVNGMIENAKINRRIEDAARAKIDRIFKGKKNGRVRTVSPVLIVACGGTGAAIARRIKAYVNELGMGEYVRIIVLDTDTREQESEGSLPGFTDQEFCHMSMDRVQTVLNDPDKHPVLKERLDLQDPDIRTQLASIAGKDLRQAGQVRVLGLLAYYANHAAVKAKLQSAIGHLNSRWAELKNQLASEEQVRLQDRFYVLMLGSSVGGTFSSIAVDLAIDIKSLTPHRTLDLVLCLTTADVYEHAMVGKADEWERIKANGVATIIEADAFATGWANQQNVHIGRSSRELVKAPAGLFSQIYLVQRRDSQGNDLVTQFAVFDTIALHFAAEVCLTIGGKLASLQMNDVARQGMSICPDVRLPRHFSTLNATALALPRRQIIRNATARQMLDTLLKNVLGSDRPAKDVQADIDAWLVEVNLEQRSSQHGANSIVDRIRRKAVPLVETFLTSFSRARTAKRRVHHKNRKFPQIYVAARQRFSDTELPEVQEAMERLCGELTTKAVRDLREKLRGLLVSGGLRGANAFLERLDAAFGTMLDELDRGIRDDAGAHKKWDESAKEAVVPLTTFFGRFGTNEQKQLRVEKCHRNAINFAFDGLAKENATKVLVEVRAQVQKVLAKFTGEIAKVKAECERFENFVAENRKSRSVTGDNLAEINVAPPNFFGQFYSDNALGGQHLLERLAGKRETSVADLILTAGSDTTIISDASSEAMGHFNRAFAKLNVVDVLAKVLERGGIPADHAWAQIRQALSKCKPMWDAEIGRLEATFAETVVLGIPQHQSAGGDQVVEAIRKEAAALMSGEAEANTVTTNDPHRIYIIRRSHGGRPHYLGSWADWKAAYRQWRDNGGHPVHIFPQKLLATLPPIEPRDEMSRADLAFAIALTYGLVAQRGPFYYRNLEQKSRNGVPTFLVPLNSHWNGIAFKDGRPCVVPGAALQTFISSGRMEFAGRNDGDTRQRLAQGREEALENFRKDETFVALVFEAFDSICESAGNTNVASELETYLRSLDGRYKVGDTHFDQVRKETELLAGLLSELRSRS